MAYVSAWSDVEEESLVPQVSKWSDVEDESQVDESQVDERLVAERLLENRDTDMVADDEDDEDEDEDDDEDEDEDEDDFLLIESDSEETDAEAEAEAGDTASHAGVQQYLVDTGLSGFVLQLPENVYHQTHVKPFDEFFDEESLDLGDLKFTRLRDRDWAHAHADHAADHAADAHAAEAPPAKRARKHPGFYNEELVQINHNVLEHRSRTPDVQVAYHAAELYCANPDAFADLCQTLPPYDETRHVRTRYRG
jgi:hypothetical protein